MGKTILLIATFDTKEQEAVFLKERIEARGLDVLLMDAGILGPPSASVDIEREEVARRGGMTLEEALATKDKGACILNMIRGVREITRELYDLGRFQGIIGIGGAQGTDIGTAGMREAPTGVPKLMVSTVASGRATFGPYVGTRDVTMMHSVADMQGLNFLTRRILDNAAGAVCGMVEGADEALTKPRGIPVGMSMLGTTTPGALRCKGALEAQEFRSGHVPPERHGRHRHGGHDPKRRLRGRPRPESP